MLILFKVKELGGLWWYYMTGKFNENMLVGSKCMWWTNMLTCG
jgi:hypothetical protein